MQTLQVEAVPNQTVSLLLSGQLTQLNIYTTSDGLLYMDVLLNNVAVVTSVLCLNNNLIVRNVSSGFLGDFIFTDTQGNLDPNYTELGTRFVLLYLTATEVAAL